MVAVLDGDGVEQLRRLSGPAGEFELPLIGPPPHALVVERIGFRRREFALDGRDGHLTLRLTADPIELPGVTVATEPVCSISSRTTSEALGAAWDLVRATLARAMLAGALQAGRGETTAFDVATYEGEMDPNLNFLRVDVDTMVLEGASPFAFVDATALDETGWADMLEDRQIRYFAPSPSLLLTAWFQANHCFALEEATADTLALHFRSAPGLKDAGIQGAFFLTRETARVARVEFRYLTGGPPAPHQGGEVVLAEGEEGSWYVGEWWMRTPIFKSTPTNFRGPVARRLPQWRQELAGYRARGGVAGPRRRRRRSRRRTSRPGPFGLPDGS